MTKPKAAASAALFAVCMGMVLCVEPSLAKHPKKAQSGSSDPCASPRAYVSDHINRIKALRATAAPASTPLFGSGGAAADAASKRSAQISQLRSDADGVNALLKAGGCPAFDLDQELSAAGR
jgi:hypothetical protein